MPASTHYDDPIITYRVEVELEDGSIHTVNAPSSKGPEGAEREAEQITLELLNGRAVEQVLSIEEA